MSEALKEAVSKMHSARAKVNKDADTKFKKNVAFAKKSKELKSQKTQDKFDKKKGECETALKAVEDAAKAQAKSTTEWEKSIKAAKEQLAKDQKEIAEFKKEWNAKLEKQKQLINIAKQLNPPGPELDKLIKKIKAPESVSKSIRDTEIENLTMQHDINEHESAMNASKQMQILDDEKTTGNREALNDKTFPQKGK
jgi:hypothetical protein